MRYAWQRYGLVSALVAGGAWEMPLLVVLAGMLRPEGVLAAAPAFLFWLWLRRADRRAWPFSVVAVVVGLG